MLYFLTCSSTGLAFGGFSATGVVSIFSSSNDDSEFFLDADFLETDFSGVLCTPLRGLLFFPRDLPTA